MTEDEFGFQVLGIVLFLAVIIYFLPAMIAVGKRNSGSIFVLNLLTGWTLFGWVAAFIWACVEKKSNTKAWISFFTSLAFITALFSSLVTLVRIFLETDLDGMQFDLYNLIDVGLLLVLGIGVGWKKSRVCAALLVLNYVVNLILTGSDVSVLVPAVIFGILYLLGLIGAFAYHREIKSHTVPRTAESG